MAHSTRRSKNSPLVIQVSNNRLMKQGVLLYRAVRCCCVPFIACLPVLLSWSSFRAVEPSATLCSSSDNSSDTYDMIRTTRRYHAAKQTANSRVRIIHWKHTAVSCNSSKQKHTIKRGSHVHPRIQTHQRAWEMPDIAQRRMTSSMTPSRSPNDHQTTEPVSLPCLYSLLSSCFSSASFNSGGLVVCHDRPIDPRPHE